MHKIYITGIAGFIGFHLAKKLVNYQFSGKFNLVEEKSDLLAYNSGDKKIPYFVVKEFVGSVK